MWVIRFLFSVQKTGVSGLELISSHTSVGYKGPSSTTQPHNMSYQGTFFKVVKWFWPPHHCTKTFWVHSPRTRSTLTSYFSAPDH